VAAEVTNLSNDQRLLHPMLAAAAHTLTTAGHVEPIGTVLADAGYCTDANLAAADPNGPELLMPPYNLRNRRDPDDACEQLGNRAPKDQSAKQRLAQRLATEHGKALYRLRSQSVEAAFGQIKEARGCRRFHRRGQSAVSSEWTFICATHNLLKLWRKTRTGRGRRPVAQPAAAA